MSATFQLGMKVVIELQNTIFSVFVKPFSFENIKTLSQYFRSNSNINIECLFTYRFANIKHISNKHIIPHLQFNYNIDRPHKSTVSG